MPKAKKVAAGPVEESESALERLLKVLNERLSQIDRPERSIERELRWRRGTLRAVLQGRLDITLRHVEELAPLLDVTFFDLLRESFAEPLDPSQMADLEPGWIDILTRQLTVVEKTVEVFQELQDLIPCPTPAEVAEMRTGRRAINKHAYLLAQVQAFICDLENVASDLKLDLEYGFDPQGAETLTNFFNALSAAVDERRLSAARDEAEAGES